MGRGLPDPAIGIALSVLAGYLAGSLPFGYWLVRIGKGVDIRTVGSGNIGGSNVWRNFGTKYGLTVTLLDVAKGFVPAFLATMYVSKLAGVLAGLAAMLGHARPLFLRFRKGGKMVATAGGVTLALAPLAALAGLAVWLIAFAVCRYASLASIATAIALPLFCLLFGASAPVVAFAVLAAVAVIALHYHNIRRLLAGTEPRFRRRQPQVPA
jgi:acyl phosphate:glycerol-3-phosphate acyltransferase